MNFKLIFGFLLIFSISQAQISVSGTVSDKDSLPVYDALITSSIASTNSDETGKFTIQVADASEIVVISASGYTEISLPASELGSIILSPETELKSVVIVGSRSYKRSAIDTPVPVDIIDVSEIESRGGQVEINQILQYAAPSFNASKQSGSDGADHIDPASLRGLGPDQTLVLINGKRRHQSSLINVYGTRGRGNTGTDLNAIPAAAIKRIEILRDGASAQYGSDAIAGVINIVLKDNVDKFTGNITYGAYNAKAKGDFPEGTPNADGKNRLYDKDRNFDGGSVKLDANYGVKIGSDGGFLNITGEFLSKNKTLRPGASFRKGYGEAEVDGVNVMVNSAIPLNDKAEIYVNGGFNRRYTDSYAFTRDKDSGNNVQSIYPDGFTPRITSKINDGSFTVGYKHNFGKNWTFDVSNAYGENKFHYTIKNTLNASLEENSPTEFDAGGHSLAQNTINLNLNKYIDNVLEGLNIAFGGEYRTENFEIFAGEEGSYATYDVNGNVVTSSSQTIPVDPISGDARPGGSQGFPGYSPDNEVDEDRNNTALYLDTELDVTDKFLIGAALRFEKYSDFGNAFTYKFASRYKLLPNLTLRAAYSTGFRAPSLAQVHYNLKFTNYVGGSAREVVLASNTSDVARAFGISSLKEENAKNFSAGVTFKVSKFTGTLDFYNIKVTDRIALTDYFDATIYPELNVNSAQFFANGIDTETNGLDIVLSWRDKFKNGSYGLSFLMNYNDMKITKINAGDLDPDTFFGPREQYYQLAAAPEYKFGVNFDASFHDFDFNIAYTQFSKVELLGYEVYEDDADFGGSALDASRDIYKAKGIIDVSASYNFLKNYKLTLGANNILNNYPTAQDENWTDGGGYWDSVQFGTSGAYYFARLGVNF